MSRSQNKMAPVCRHIRVAQRGENPMIAQNSSDTNSQKMSSRRSRSRQSSSGRITDQQIDDLMSKLQSLLHEARLGSHDRASAAKVLQDTCSYIRSLHREVDDLSERLSELLDAAGVSSDQAASIRSLFMQER